MPLCSGSLAARASLQLGQAEAVAAMASTNATAIKTVTYCQPLLRNMFSAGDLFNEHFGGWKPPLRANYRVRHGRRVEMIQHQIDYHAGDRHVQPNRKRPARQTTVTLAAVDQAEVDVRRRQKRHRGCQND